MKNSLTILSLVLGLFLVSCGGKKEEKKAEATKDTVAEKPAAKDFVYFAKAAKDFTLDGIEFNLSNYTVDSVGKYFYFTYDVKDPAKAGIDVIQINASSVARLGNKEDVVVASLADFQKVQEKFATDKKETLSDFKEVKKNDITFYYYTNKNASDMMGGQKNYRMLYSQGVVDDVYMDIMVKVYDSKASLAKAEQVLLTTIEKMTK
jgi:mannitol-specific phosphotransferase system IIBC component